MLDAFKRWASGPTVRAAAASYARTYASVMLGYFIADGADVLGVSVAELRTWQAAALAAALAPLARALNPDDPAFGRTRPTAPDDPEEGVPAVEVDQ